MINQPWWQMLGVVLMFAIIAIVFAGLTAKEGDASEPDEWPTEAGRSNRRGSRFSGRLGRSLSAVLSLGLRRSQPALGTADIIPRISGPTACSTWDKPRKHLGGLTLAEEVQLQIYLRLNDHTAGGAENPDVYGTVRHLSDLKGRNTPERSVQFGTGNQLN